MTQTLKTDYKQKKYCFRPLLKELKTASQFQILVDSKIENALELLKQGHEVKNMLEEYTNYVLTSLVCAFRSAFLFLLKEFLFRIHIFWILVRLKTLAPTSPVFELLISIHQRLMMLLGIGRHD